MQSSRLRIGVPWRMARHMTVRFGSLLLATCAAVVLLHGALAPLLFDGLALPWSLLVPCIMIAAVLTRWRTRCLGEDHAAAVVGAGPCTVLPCAMLAAALLVLAVSLAPAPPQPDGQQGQALSVGLDGSLLVRSATGHLLRVRGTGIDEGPEVGMGFEAGPADSRRLRRRWLLMHGRSGGPFDPRFARVLLILAASVWTHVSIAWRRPVLPAVALLSVVLFTALWP